MGQPLAATAFGFFAAEVLLLVGLFLDTDAFDVGRFDAAAFTLGLLALLFELLAFAADALLRADLLLDAFALRLPRACRERATRSRPFQPTALSARKDAGIASTSP